MAPPKAPNLPRTAKPAKRSRTDGSLSSPHIIQSRDSEDDVPLVHKRRKPSSRAQVPLQLPAQVVEESSDDEPLITRIERYRSSLPKSAVASARDGSDGIGQVATSSPANSVAAAASLPSRSHLPAVFGLSHNTRRLAGTFSSPTSALAYATTPSPLLPPLQTSFPLWGRQRNLKSAFESVSRAPRADPPTSATGPNPQAAVVSSPGTEFSPFTPRPPRSGLQPTLRSNPAASHATQPKLAGISHQLEDPFVSSAPSSSRLRVPTPNRLFTNMSLQNVNKLILSMPKVVKEEKSRSAKKTKTTASLKHASAQNSSRAKVRGDPRSTPTKRKGARKITQELDNVNMSEAEEAMLNVAEVMLENGGLDLVDALVSHDESGDGADDEGFSGVDIHVGEVMDHMGDDESALPGDSEDEETASPTAAKRSRMDKDVAQSLQHRPKVKSKSLPTARTSVVKKPSAQQPQISRTAGLAREASVIDLTDDTPLTPQQSLEKGSTSRPTTKDAAPLAANQLPQPPSVDSTAQRSDITQKREAVFLSAFKQHWYQGASSFRAAVNKVNTTLHPSTRKFSHEEGDLQLRALAAQGKLAIRNDHVYHLDQDPGPDAPPPPLVKTGALTQAQRHKQSWQEANNSPVPSFYGPNILNARYKLFQSQLHDQVFTKQLFANDRNEETLGKCLEELNRDLDRGRRLSLKEISAAFVYMSKKGDIVLEGEMVRFTKKGMS